MTELFLKYNPYIVETEMKIDGELVVPPNRLADWKNERLQNWIENLMPALEDICNDDEYIIDFYGTTLDYNDLEVCVNEYCEEHNDVKVKLRFTKSAGTQNRMKELIELFDDMQRNCPFEDLTTEQVKENFNSAVGSEFEVSVIATMSSGKSTLINAFLGRELMPSKNEACTATIAKIKDIDGMDHFTGEYRDQENHLLGSYENLTLENMNEMNNNPETAFIDIKGDISNIDSKGVKLVLVDTPGPNNSRTEEHKNHTYRVIKEKTKPMVLYVLNATQLQTNDDKELLTAVSDAMKVGGKQSKDRFLFAVNKVDLFDPDKESVEGAINNVKNYLDKFGIKNPNIFPTSAELAKVIRMKKNNQPLTSAQKRTLRDYDFFIEEDQLHLSEQATLSPANKKKIEKMLTEARSSGDGEDEALIHTGIPAVELAIDEYLKKYAYTTKVKTAVDAFKKKVEEKDMHSKMLKAIHTDEQARQNINAQLKFVGQQLADGKSASQFSRKIEKLDMTKDAETRIKKLRARVSATLMKRESKDVLTTLEVQQILMKLERIVSDIQSDVKTDLENIIEDVIVSNAQSIMEEYKKQVHLLITSGDLATEEFEAGKGINFLEKDVPNAQEIIDRYKYNEQYDTGQKEWVKNLNKKWYKPWTWFQKSGWYETIYANREMVKYSDVYDDFVQPIIKNFNENLDGAKKTAQEEADRFKRFFINELNALNETLERKVKETEALTRDQDAIERKLAEEKNKVKWLETFMQRLDSILDI